MTDRDETFNSVDRVRDGLKSAVFPLARAENRAIEKAPIR